MGEGTVRVEGGTTRRLDSDGDQPDCATAEIKVRLAMAKTVASLIGRSSTSVRIGRYEALEIIGEGGMGVVYAARDDELDRKVAVKLLRTEVDPGSRGRTRLRLEAKALAKLSHPNVVHVYEVGDHDGQVFVAMELVEGQTLRKWQRRVQRDWQEIVAAYVAAGRGLAAAHDAELVHRDFKPDNVLVGDDGRPRVVDFGLARAGAATVEDPSTESAEYPIDPNSDVSLTASGTVVGTLAYMSPEQLRGDRADARSDQFSFCVALYEALFGQRPYAGKTVHELRRAIAAARPQRAMKRHRTVPAAVRRAIARGLQIDPEDRYPEISGLLDELCPRPAPGRWRAIAVAGLAATLAGTLAIAATTRDEPTEALSAVPEDDGWAELVAASDLPAEVPTPLDDDPFGVTVHRLRNGLTVYILPSREQPTIRAAVAIRMSARDEPTDGAGLAHLATHMLGTGTARMGTLDFEREKPFLAARDALYNELEQTQDRTRRDELIAAIDHNYRASSSLLVRGEMDKAIEEIGGEILDPARTPGAVLGAIFPSTALELYCELEAERLRRPVFRGFVSEVASILDEARFGLDGQWADWQAVVEELDRLVGSGGPVLREAEVAAEMPFRETREFFRQYVVPNNIAIVLVGDVEPQAALQTVERHFGSWEPKLLPARAVVDRPVDGGRIERYVPGLGGPRVTLSWPLPASLRRDRRVVKFLSELMWHSANGAAPLAGVQDIDLDLAGGFTIFATPTPGASSEDAAAAVIDRLETIARGEVDPELVEAVSTRRAVQVAHWRAEPHPVAGIIAESFAGRNQWAATARMVAGAPPTIEDVAAAALSLLARGVIVAHRTDEPYNPPKVPEPAIERSELKTSGQSQFVGEALARPRSLLEPLYLFEGRHYEVDRREGRVFVTAQLESPLFFLRVEFPVGAAHDRWACAAVQSRFEDTLRALSELGVDTWVDCGRNSTAVALTGLSTNLDAALGTIEGRLIPATVTPRAAARFVQTELQARERARAGMNYMQAAMRDLVSWEPDGGLQQLLPTDAAVRGVTPSTLTAGLNAVLGSKPDVTYAGPRAKPIADRLARIGGGLDRPALAPWRNRASRRGADGKPPVFVVDQPGRTFALIVVSLASPARDPQARTVEDVVRAYLRERLRRELMDGPGIAGGTWPMTLRPAGSPGALVVMVQLGHAHVAEALDRVLELLAKPIDAAAFERARRETEEFYRGGRVPAHAIPNEVLRFVQNGQEEDPRLEQWSALGRMGRAEVAAYTAKLRNTVPTVGIVADLDELDLRAMRRPGLVRRVALEDVVRSR